jgi:hypothetical protein
MVEVVNRHFVGSGESVHVVNIRRPFVLGNQFRIGRDGTREQVIDKYRVWLWQSIRERGAVYRLLAQLAEVHKAGRRVVLVCCCKPLPCHGDVIQRAIEWLAG